MLIGSCQIIDGLMIGPKHFHVDMLVVRLLIRWSVRHIFRRGPGCPEMGHRLLATLGDIDSHVAPTTATIEYK